MSADWGAGRYEVVAELLVPAARAVVDAADVEPGDRVLDVCCGTGNAAALATAAGGDVDGIDLAQRLVDVAAERVPGARFAVADATRLPFADASFDAVVSVFGVIFADAEAAAAELLRVTRPGGRIVLAAWVGHRTALNACGAIGRELAEVRADAAPQRPPVDWWEADVIDGLFGSRPQMLMAAELEVRADSPAALADLMLDHQPMFLAAREVVGPDRYEALRAEFAAVYADAGTVDERGFRLGLPYKVVHVVRT